MVLGRFGPISFRASGHPADLRICGPFGWNTIGYCTSGLRAEPFTISKGDLIVSVFSRLVLGSMVALLFTGLTVAEDPKPKELTGDAKTVQGRWVSKDESGESTWVFEGDKLKLDTPTRKYRMVCKLDTETKPHKSIDLDVQPDSPNAAGTLGKGPGRRLPVLALGDWFLAYAHALAVAWFLASRAMCSQVWTWGEPRKYQERAGPSSFHKSHTPSLPISPSL